MKLKLKIYLLHGKYYNASNGNNVHVSLNVGVSVGVGVNVGVYNQW